MTFSCGEIMWLTKRVQINRFYPSLCCFVVYEYCIILGWPTQRQHRHLKSSQNCWQTVVHKLKTLFIAIKIERSQGQPKGMSSQLGQLNERIWWVDTQEDKKLKEDNLTTGKRNPPQYNNEYMVKKELSDFWLYLNLKFCPFRSND